MKKTICTICNTESDFLFSGKVLNKYTISYYKCPCCGFIQTENPYWLGESYQEAITDLDIGYVQRNLYSSKITAKVINNLRGINKKGRFLDYGGGYGLFVRLMRDKGFDFYRQDEYCRNLFSNFFDVNDLKVKEGFELMTCFEVFEHLTDPVSELEKMLNYSRTILFTTELQPEKGLKSVADWWYFSPEIGQHIAFFTKESLECLAKKFNLNLYTDGRSLHLLTDKKAFLLSDFTFKTYRLLQGLSSRFADLFRGRSGYYFIQQDLMHVKSIINASADNWE